MALTVKQLVNRHGAFVSAVTALLVFAALMAQEAVQYLISILLTGQVDGFPFSFIFLIPVPFSVGFFVSLWIIGPIAEELRVPHVVTRAILASGVASTVVFIVLAITGLLGALSFEGSLFANSFPTLRLDGAPAALARALATAASTFVSRLPLGVLAGVLLWLWRKDHPPKHPLSGLIDEV